MAGKKAATRTRKIAPNFGRWLRKRRLKLRRQDQRYSLRQVAGRIGVEPSYLSKVERGIEAPPSEAKVTLLARELGAHPDTLLALAGKISTDLKRIIQDRPRLLGEFLRDIKKLPDHAVARLQRRTRPGKRR